MGKCGIIYSNFIFEETPELVLGTISEGYDIENLTEGRAQKLIEMPVVSHVRIRFTFATAQTVSGCAFVNHNFSTATTINCVGGDTVVEVEAATPDMTGNAFGKTTHFTAAAVSKKIWDFNIYMSGMTGTAYLGELYLGTFAEFEKNYNYGYSDSIEGTAITIVNGILYRAEKYDAESLENLTFDFSTAQELTHRPYFVQNYAVFIPDVDEDKGHYGIWINPYRPTHRTFNLYTIKNTFKEDALNA